MTLKRTLPFFVIILIATGCFRQSSDTFDTVDSGSGDTATQVIIAPTETEDTAVTIIAVDMDDLTPTDEPTAESVDAESADSATPTEVAVQATTMPTATDFPEPTEEEDSSAAVLPTATTATFITPEPVVAIENPTAVPTSVAPTRNPALQSTPSDEEAAAEDAPTEDAPTKCEYVVQSGDNLFRIALNNNVALEDLLAENELTENSIIQPGQQLLIPGCEDEGSAEATVEATEDVESTEEAVVLEDGFRLHTVAAGETLLTIARQYGVTVNDILHENEDITDPNRIVPGQELLIPPADE